MYIDNWWGDYIGSSADSAVLLRYFEQDGQHFIADFYPIWAEHMAEVAAL